MSDDKKKKKKLVRSNKPVLLVVNKVDNEKLQMDAFEFYSLGLGDLFCISSVHGIGIGDVLDKVTEIMPPKNLSSYDGMTSFCVIGRPNVGKSSLVNAILKEDRVIVSNIEGTTRDAIDTPFRYEGEEYIIIDTAGIRKKGKIYEDIEKYSILRALNAIDRSNVVLFLIDGSLGIREQDKHVAGYAHEAGRGVIIVVNKWDTLKKNSHSMADFEKAIRQEFQYLSYAPIVFVSAKTHQRLNTLPALIKKVNTNHERRITSSVLNEVILDAIAQNPTPTDNGKRLRIYYATQVSVKPPTFVVFVNDPDLMHFSYERFLENQIRASFDFTGTPVHLIIRRRK